MRSGESASVSAEVGNTGATAAQWTLEVADGNNRANNLEGVLAAIDASGTTLNGPLPSRFDFSEGETGTSISTGNPSGWAIFSQGNKLNSSLGGPLAYSNGVIQSSSTLGAGGRYFTRKLPGLFLFAGDLNGPSWFEVAGSLSYGSFRESAAFNISRHGKRWSAFVVKTADYWRTINQLILVDQDGLGQTVSSYVSNQQQRVTGLSGKRRLYYLLFVSSNTTFQPDSVFQELASRLLDTVPAPMDTVLGVAPSSGTTATNSHTQLTATANATGFPQGDYPATLNLKAAAGAVLDSVPVTIQVTAPRLNPPAAVQQSAVPGMLPVIAEVPLTTGLTEAQPWSATLPTAPSWLGIVNPAGTTPEPLKLRFDAGSLAAGTYRADVRITSGPATFEIPVGFTVTPLAISKFHPDPARPLLYAINKNGLETGSLLVIDPVTRRIQRSISVGKEPTDLDLTEDGSRLLVINSKDPSISVINPADWQVVETVPLTEFSSRSRVATEPGAHLKCGKGDMVYYVDEQWGPRLRVFDLRARKVLQTLSSESGTSPDVSNNFGYGGIALNPAGTRLFGWGQYGDGAGVINTRVVRFNINAAGTLEGYTKSANYNATNFTREPLDSPVLFSPDGKRLIIKDREVDQDQLDVFPRIYLDEIYSLAPNGTIAASASAIHSVTTGESLAALPVTSAVQALLPDLSALVYFNTATSTLGWFNLEAALGAPALGLKTSPSNGQAAILPDRLEWPPVHGYTRYQIYLGTNEADVLAATPASPLYLGTTDGTSFQLPAALPAGPRYFWRVLPVDVAGNAVGAGTVRSFIASSFLLNPTSVTRRLPLTIEPQQVSIAVTGAGGQPVSWSVSEAIPWFAPDANSGAAGTPVTGRIVPGSTAAGSYTGSLAITAEGMSLEVPLAVTFYTPDLIVLKADPARDRVYGLHRGATTAEESQLLAIRASTGAVDMALSVGGNAQDFAITPDGGRIYVSNYGRSRMQVVDPATFTLLSPFAVGSDVMGVAADGKGRVFANRAVGFEMLDGTTGASLWTSSSAYNFNWGAVNAAGTRYYTTNTGTNWNLVGYDVGVHPPVAIRTVNLSASNPERLALSADGSRLFNWGRAFDPELNPAGASGEPVKCTVSNGSLAVGATKMWWVESGSQAATLPFSAGLSVVSRDDRFLLLYNATTRAVTSVPLSSLVPFPGLKPVPGASLAAGQAVDLAWPVVNEAVSYRLFLGTVESEVQAAVAGSTLEQGVTAAAGWSLSAPPAFGYRYFWRVDAITGDGRILKGSVWWFEVPMPALAPALTLSASSRNAGGLSLNLTEFGIGLAELQNSGYYVLKRNPADGSPSLWQSFFANNSYISGKRSLVISRKNAVMGDPTTATGGSSSTNDGKLTVLERAADHWQGSSTLSPPSLPSSAQLGASQASDGNLFMAGMPGGSAGGRVAVYREYPDFALMQEFKPTGGLAGDNFGAAVALQGNRALIGAPHGWTTPGKAYIFELQPSTQTWIQRAVLAPSSPGSLDMTHGASVALDGDTAVVGTSSSYLNQASVFTRVSATSWALTATIPEPSGAAAANFGFGYAMALDGDTLFVSDLNAKLNGAAAGVVHVFRRAGSAWRLGASIKPPAGAWRFGYALAARDGVLYVSSDSAIHCYRISDTPQRMPRFTTEPPIQVVEGRGLDLEIAATDPDGDAGLALRSEILPAGLALQDFGSGRAKLTGTPPGLAGTTHFLRWRATDPEGHGVYQTTRVTVVGADQMPVLAAFPVNQQPPAGSDVVLSAAATGVGPFRWQWFKDGVEIPGATGPKLYLEEISANQAGTYSVSVSNIVGTVTSANAVVAVRAPDLHAGDWETYGNTTARHGHQAASLAGYRLMPAWTAALPSRSSYSSAVIARGRVHLQPGTYYDASGPLRALDLTTGTELWNFPHTSSRYVGPPSVRDGHLFFQKPGAVNRLDAATGALDWANTSFSSQTYRYGPLAATDDGIFAINGYYGYLMGFEANGSTRFSYALGDPDGWAPAYQNGRLFTWAGGVFQEHSTSDGTSLWNLSNLSGEANFAVRSGCAVLASSSALTCIDTGTRAVRWQVSGNFRGLPAIAGGIAYAIQGNTVRAYSLADGAVGTSYQTSAPSGALPADQPLVLLDRVIVSNTTHAWVFNREDGALLQTLEGGGTLCYADGYLIHAGTDNLLRAYVALHDNANLAGLALDSATLNPSFDTGVADYFATVPFATQSLTVTPTTEQSGAAVTVDGTAVASGSASMPVPLAVGNQTITIRVTAEDRETTRIYQVKVTRLPENFVFNSASDVPVATDRFDTGGFPVRIVLNFKPEPGTILTMVDHSGLDFIRGTFGNLAQGQRVTLNFGGRGYDFIANYFGGTGNDLVMQWADTAVMAWGSNSYGQLGDAGTTHLLAPTTVDASGVLSGKTLTAVSTGYLHSLALCSDGTLAAWGYNVYGQLGNNATAASSVPVAVDSSGALAGRTVVAIAAGPFHNLALCSDGTIAAWGYNNYGQLGTGDKLTRRAPALVTPVGALAGKRVVAVVAGAYHSFALCSDGSVAAWGYNDEGELGDGTSTGSLIPVAVSLSGRKVLAITAGQYHAFARCADGALLAWGYNSRGQLGDATTAASLVPVDISGSGALAGKSVTAVAAGTSHSLALCSDGSLAAWGYNHRGQLGVATGPQSTTPLGIGAPGALAGRDVSSLIAGGNHTLVRAADGSLAAWGDNSAGQLGVHNTENPTQPVSVDLSSIPAGARSMLVASGAASSHNLLVVGLPSDYPPSTDPADQVRLATAAGDLPGGAAGDPDHDGIANLIEYAFGLNPNENSAGQLPTLQRTGDRLVLAFTQPTGVTGITYGAEWSADMSPGSWTEIPDTGTGGEHRFSLPPGTEPRVFMRMKVTKP